VNLAVSSINMDEDNAGLRLLSLDGGGIRGLSELLILKKLMEKIKSQQKLEDEPLPCEYFDMIGGTGAGGLIALMLGRLCMSVSEAIHHYESFSKTVFSGGKKYFGDGKFKASVFEDAVKRIVEAKTKVADLRLRVDDSRWNKKGCNTFVCARLGNHLSASTPTLFCTYPEDHSPDCTIWEAARATSAAPTFFKSIRIGGTPYIDGGIGYNNPTEAVLDQARLIYPDQKIACIISIGSGMSSVPRIVKGNLRQKFVPNDVIRLLIAVATDCESTSESMAQYLRTSPDIYFRFNVVQELQDIRLEEWDRLGRIASPYLNTSETSQKMERAVDVLLQRRGVISIENLY